MKVFALKKLTPLSLVALSIVLAASTPVATVNAQAQMTTRAQQTLDQFKQKINTAIDNSLTKLKSSKESLDVSLSVTANGEGVTSSVSGGGSSAQSSVNKDGASGSVTTKNGSTASGNVSKDGATGSASTSGGSSASGSVTKDEASADVSTSRGGNASITATGGSFSGSLSVSPELKEKLKAANQKAIDKLSDLKQQVEETNKLDDLQQKAKEFDAAFKEIAIANVQATVTKSIDSMTQVLDRLQVAASNLESQVDKIKECLQSAEVDASAQAGRGSANASINASAPGCEDLNVDANSGDMGASLQEKIDTARSTMQTIRSFISSTIALVGELKSGNYSNTMTSFQGIASQLDVVSGLVSSVQNDLVNLSSSIKKA